MGISMASAPLRVMERLGNVGELHLSPENIQTIHDSMFGES